MRRIHQTERLFIVTCIPALLALAWFFMRARADQSAIADLKRVLARANRDSAFPRPGDSLADLRYRVWRGVDTLALGQVITAGPAAVYFESAACPSCKALEHHLDSLDAGWSTRVLRVSVDTGGGPVNQWRLVRDSTGQSPVTVIPSALSIDARGLVTSAGLGGLLPAATVIAASSRLTPAAADRLVASLRPIIEERRASPQSTQQPPGQR